MNMAALNMNSQRDLNNKFNMLNKFNILNKQRVKPVKPIAENR